MMTYTRSDLHVISDAVELIKKDPPRYLEGAERATGEYLAARLVSSLIWISAFPAKVSKSGEWWLVSSDKDWLASSDLRSVADAFATIVPMPRAGRNSHQAEILLTAFADVVVTSNREDIAWIKGDSSEYALPEELNSRSTGGGRIVAFKV
jgi:hypothetical protein